MELLLPLETYMAKKRDYKAEYRKRIERALAKGFSVSQARGHAKQNEKPISKSAKKRLYDPRLEKGLKEVRRGKSLTNAAKSIGAAPKTLKKYIEQSGVAKAKDRGLQFGADRRSRELLLYSSGQEVVITVKGFKPASLIGRYMATVRQFLATNDPSVLEPFKGQFVVDSKGQKYVFETRPNVLYRLAASGTESFEEIYRIVA
jgi:hypothetical protein